jgi:hypothetical protein
MGSNNKIPFNSTVIKNGKIVRIRKDGNIKAVLGDYKTKHRKQLKKKNDR